jgi:hypothetical protein
VGVKALDAVALVLISALVGVYGAVVVLVALDRAIRESARRREKALEGELEGLGVRV